MLIAEFGLILVQLDEIHQGTINLYWSFQMKTFSRLLNCDSRDWIVLDLVDTRQSKHYDF